MAQASLFETNSTISGAVFSECRKYRYSLWRVWDEARPKVMFIGLNPSTAKETEPDPTIGRVVEFAKAWGFGGVYMMNLFAFVTAYPEELETCTDPVRENNRYLKAIARGCSEIVVAYGNFKQAKVRAKEIHEMFPITKAIIINKNGSPRHPLYIKGDAKRVDYTYPLALPRNECI